MNRSEETEQIFRAAFAPETYRDPRSLPYREGVRASIENRLAKIDGEEPPEIRCPYAKGTAEADAFYAGCSEGHWRATSAREAKIE